MRTPFFCRALSSSAHSTQALGVADWLAQVLSSLSTETVLSLANAVHAIRQPIPLLVHEHQNVILPDV